MIERVFGWVIAFCFGLVAGWIWDYYQIRKGANKK